jgi:hypothetical protein
MKFDHFVDVDFNPTGFTPKSAPGFVYVLCWVAQEQEIPFYVGETHSAKHRLEAYYWADFQASTDFKVGEAVKHLCGKNLRVIAKIMASTDRWQKENEIIQDLRAKGVKLMNDCRNYDYRTADKETERARIQQFVDDILNSTQTPAKAPQNSS